MTSLFRQSSMIYNRGFNEQINHAPSSRPSQSVNTSLNSESPRTKPPINSPRKENIGSPRTRSQKLQAAGQSIVHSTSPREDKSLGHDTRLIYLNSAPVVVFEKPVYTNFGRTKVVSLSALKMAEGKYAADGVMASLGEGNKPRFAKVEQGKHTLHPNRRPLPHIEVLVVEGNHVLGVPGTSRVQYYSALKERDRRKQVLIAMHDASSVVKVRGAGGATGGKSTESEAAVMRSGVVALSRQLVTVRDSLGATRVMHNTFNEKPKYSFD